MLRPDTLPLTVLLALLTAVGPLSTDMYLPSLPDITRLLTASAADVQLTLSAYLIGFALGQVVYGPLSDHHGRKPVLVAALGVFCVASLACAAAPSIKALIVARVLQAFGGSGAIVLARAIVRDLYDGVRAGRELALMGAIMALAPVIAPLIGGVLQSRCGWRASFVVLVGLGALAIAVVAMKLPETLHRRAPEPVSLPRILGAYGTFAQDRSFLAHLGIISASYAGLFAWISGSSFVLQDLYGLTALGFSAAFALSCVGYLIGTALAAWLVARLGLDRTIGFGALALAGGGLAMVPAVALSTSALLLVLPSVLYLCGLGLAMPQAVAGALIPFPDRAGSASSMLGFVQQTSAAAVGAVVGQLIGASAWPLAIAIAAMGCLALALWAASRQVRRA
jgi:DHA1 family bicyclomycin/chloramphenicol resistance-like MFS transporter